MTKIKNNKQLILLICTVIFIAFILLKVVVRNFVAYSGRTYITPALGNNSLDTLWYVDSTFKASLCFANNSSAPITMRLLVNWSGHEHIMDNDSELIAWIRQNPVTNLACILKTQFSGSNRNTVTITDDQYESKKYRLVEYLEGFEGRLCSDYANLAGFILSRAGFNVRRITTGGHTFNAIQNQDSTWGTFDFDPSTQILHYDSSLQSIINNRDLLFTQPVFEDTISPYKSISKKAGLPLSVQMFWHDNITPALYQDIIPWQVPLPDTMAHTDNSIILCEGCNLRYTANCKGLILNSDIPANNSLKNKIFDSLNYYDWNEFDSPNYNSSLRASGITLENEYLHAFFPSDSVVIKGIRSNALFFQSTFNQYLNLPLSESCHQLIELTIPPHTDTLYAGTDYRFPFWVEKIELNGNAKIGNRLFNGKGVFNILNISDSVVQDTTNNFKRLNDNVQTLTDGYFAPSPDTTKIWLHFNSGIFNAFKGIKYEVLNGVNPVVTTAPPQTFHRE